MEDAFRFADGLGPEKIIHVHEPRLGLRAILVIDNVAAGPSIGGIRMAPDVNLEECVRLARAMTLKNAAAGLPHGGGKSVIVGDPKMPRARKARHIRAFARAIAPLADYIPGPDMGTDETCMAWIKDEIGRAVGLPREIGGIPLDEVGATGFGLAASIDVAKDFCGIALKGARVAVQGFGAVGKHAARFLAEKGAVLVAAADANGTIADPRGLDVRRLIEHKDAGRSVVDFAPGAASGVDAILDVECEIWIPAARPDVLRADNVARLKTKLVAQGANIPATAEAETVLHRRGILSIPDFIANAGGVICAAVEYRHGTAATAFESIEEKIRANTREVLEGVKASGKEPRAVALDLAAARVKRAMALQRWAE
ncbi:MAG: Glu/Leu/Phe/Val dehydrogenase [Alphaproteobacteria bacterium]